MDRPFDATKTDKNGVDRYYSANAGDTTSVEEKLKEMNADYLIIESDISVEENVKSSHVPFSTEFCPFPPHFSRSSIKIAANKIDRKVIENEFWTLLNCQMYIVQFT